MLSENNNLKNPTVNVLAAYLDSLLGNGIGITSCYGNIIKCCRVSVEFCLDVISPLLAKLIQINGISLS